MTDQEVKKPSSSITVEASSVARAVESARLDVPIRTCWPLGASAILATALTERAGSKAKALRFDRDFGTGPRRFGRPPWLSPTDPRDRWSADRNHTCR